MEKKEFDKLIKTLEDGIKDIFQSANYKRYLDMMLQYPYSINNTILIFKQCPEATLVKSFKAWNKLGVNIKKGARAIRILCPVKYQYEPDEDEEDPLIKEFLRFKVGYVFDVSQTSQKEAPHLVQNLTQDSCTIASIIKRILDHEDDIILEDETLNDKVNGYLSLEDGLIHIKKGLSDLQCLKTLLHEKTHQLLHDKNYDLRLAEIEAESVAYLLLKKIGFDSSSYSFNYVAAYLDEYDTRLLKAALVNIKQAFEKLSPWLESYLE